MYRATAVESNRQMLDGGAMFGNAPKAVWEKWAEPDHKNRIELACRSLLIETDQRKILCEVGVGNFFEPKLAKRFGIQDPERNLLLENLQRLGVSPNEIDTVILSHLHFDHAGGLLPHYETFQSGKFSLNFPNAVYIVGEKAFARAEKPHPRDRASFVPEMVRELKNSGRLILVSQDTSEIKEVAGTKVFFSEGHTPGQMHTMFCGKKRNIVFMGDLIPGTAWVHVPITTGYDRFPERVIDEKVEFLKEADQNSWVLFYTHDPRFAASEVRADENGRYVFKNEMTDLSAVKF